MPSSSHTVLSSRGTPSIVTCHRVLLRPPQGRKQAREPRSSEFPLHVAREGVVVRDLLLDLQEFVVEAAALVLQALQRIEEMLLSEAPPLRLLPGYLEGTGHCQRPLGIGDTWDREGRVCASPLRSVRSRSYSRIFLRTPSNSFRNVIRRRSTCRRRSRTRFRRSRHFLCSSKASSTLEGSMGAAHSSWSRLFNRDVCALLCLHLRGRQDGLEQVEEVHRLAHDVARDPIRCVEPEDELQVVDLPHAHEVRNGSMRCGFAHADLADEILPLPGRGQREDVAAALQLFLRDCRHLGFLFFRHRGRLPPAQSLLAVIKSPQRNRRHFDGDLYRTVLARRCGLVV